MNSTEKITKKIKGRSFARDAAFKILFQSSMHSNNINELFEYTLTESPELMKHMDYIKKVVLGILENKEEIDNIISDNLTKGWKITRIAKVPFYILELAVYEMKYVEDVPARVAINEAVDLAKKYSDPENSSFVNGLLSGVYKKLNEK